MASSYEKLFGMIIKKDTLFQVSFFDLYFSSMVIKINQLGSTQAAYFILAQRRQHLLVLQAQSARCAL